MRAYYYPDDGQAHFPVTKDTMVYVFDLNDPGDQGPAENISTYLGQVERQRGGAATVARKMELYTAVSHMDDEVQ